MNDNLKFASYKLQIYKKPFYYTLIHILFGFLSFYYLWFGLFFIMYQLLQLFLNKRFFLFQLKIEEGNSLLHTGFKLGEFSIGVLIGFLVYKEGKLRLPKL